MNIVSTIVPIFMVILLGLVAKHRGFFSPEFLGQANRLIYYFAIPAMIFNAISKATLRTQFHLPVILITLTSILLLTAAAWGAARMFSPGNRARGTFIQSSFHGNLGYVGLAVAFYYLGEQGLARASIIAGFVMILQNLLAVIVLQYHSQEENGGGLWVVIKTSMTNPVILSALAGMLFSLSGLAMPLILERTLVIIKGMALPMALMIIGASLSFEKLKPLWKPVMASAFLKLLALPALGMTLFSLFSIDGTDFLPGLIILSSPTATLVYVMAREIGGDPDFAVEAISISTILSSLTYGLWLSMG